MTFDVQNVDLDQLAKVAAEGGIEALEDLANGKEVKTPEPEKTDPEVVDPDPAAEAKAPATEPEKTAPEPEPKPDDKDHGTAVASKDGKGTIPYAVLKGARERATQLEQQNLELQRQNQELLRQKESAATAAGATAQIDEVDEQITKMQEQVDSLKADFPEMAALLEGQMTLLRETRKELVSLQSRYEAKEQESADQAQATIQEQIRDAIDGNPVLAFWESKKGPEWAAAVEMDTMLRQKDEWVSKSFAERFAKAVDLVRVMHPEFEVPTESQPSTPAATSTEQTAQAAASDKRPAPINSLSDVPGGVPPAGSKREQVEEMSAAALGNKFSSMSTEQINEYLASLAM